MSERDFSWAVASSLSPDVGIATHALETGAELLSFDRYFDAIDGLPWTPFAPD